MNSGTRDLSDGAKLAIWEREDGYYWLIDNQDDEGEGQRRADVGPFETAREAEEDARAWWASQHAAEDPFLDPNRRDPFDDDTDEEDDEA